MVAILGNVKPEKVVRLSFYWPGMRKIIQDYVRSCAQCQLRSRPVNAHHAPITPFTRAELPFQVMNMDGISPLDPPSAQGHTFKAAYITPLLKKSDLDSADVRSYRPYGRYLICQFCPSCWTALLLDSFWIISQRQNFCLNCSRLTGCTTLQKLQSSRSGRYPVCVGYRRCSCINAARLVTSV